MKNKLRNVIRCVTKQYSYFDNLTDIRLIKMIYLIDQKNIEINGVSMTNVQWDFGRYGAYSYEIIEEIEEDDMVNIEFIISNLGVGRYMVQPTPKLQEFSCKELTESEQNIISEIVNKTQTLLWNRFLDFVYDVERKN